MSDRACILRPGLECRNLVVRPQSLLSLASRESRAYTVAPARYPKFCLSRGGYRETTVARRLPQTRARAVHLLPARRCVQRAATGGAVPRAWPLVGEDGDLFYQRRSNRR